jgi:hypothetical protein
MPGQLKEIVTIDLGSGALPVGGTANWEQPEEGRRWAIGRSSMLRFPVQPMQADLLLMFTVDPFVCAALPKQTLRVVVNGTTLRLARFGRRAIVTCRIDQEKLREGAELDIRFEHPEVVQPNMVSESTDARPLSVAFVSLSLASWTEAKARAAATDDAPAAEPRPLPPESTLSDAELMLHFASLGDNCEFGMAQRTAGAEPLDLLRFAALQLVDLLRGIKEGFANVENIDDLTFEVRVAGGRREYVLRQRHYMLDSHTLVDEGQMSTPRLYRREMNKLEVLSRLLRADMRSARRIFVYKRNDTFSSGYVAPILEALQQWGPNTLLHVVQSDGSKPPGTVEKVGPGLLRGYIDRFSTYDNAAVPPSPVWLQLCRNSYRLWQRG